MAWFRVRLVGEGFLLKTETSVVRMSFRTFRLVEAEGLKGAEKAAALTLAKAPELEGRVRNAPSDSPRVRVESVERIEGPDGEALAPIEFFSPE